jgi:AcrR family transcriptional regulator
MSKSEETRERLSETAVRLLRTRGFSGTTMRLLAEEAGVSVGNAYYYFPSKDDLVQELYLHIQIEHRAALGTFLDEEPRFQERLAGVLHRGFEIAAKYHAFGAEFIGSALPPDSATSPFGPDAGAARDMAVDLFRTVVAGSDLKAPADLRAELPELLWFMFMAAIMFWVFDRSEDQRRTHELIDKLVPMTTRLIGLSRLPLIKGQVDDMLEIFRMVQGL